MSSAAFFSERGNLKMSQITKKKVYENSQKIKSIKNLDPYRIHKKTKAIKEYH